MAFAEQTRVRYVKQHTCAACGCVYRYALKKTSPFGVAWQKGHPVCDPLKAVETHPW